eukprot:12524916-Alexandrium_andersonii.AAC.1
MFGAGSPRAAPSVAKAVFGSRPAGTSAPPLERDRPSGVRPRGQPSELAALTAASSSRAHLQR